MLGSRRRGGFSKLLDRIATPAATRGRVVAIWKQLGATIGPCATR